MWRREWEEEKKREIRRKWSCIINNENKGYKNMLHHKNVYAKRERKKKCLYLW